MDYAHQLNAEHEARKRRLWNPPRRAIVPTPAQVVAPVVFVAPPIISPKEIREVRLRALQEELRDLSRRVREEMLFEERSKIDAPPRPPVSLIVRTVAAYYNIPLNDFLSPRREREVVRPRQVAMYLCKLLTLRSLPDIGRRLGNRDHTTVLHGVRQIDALRISDEKINSQVEELIALLTVPAQGS